MRRGGLRKGLLAVLLASVVVLALGTLGYVFIEGWSVLEALYMTLTTVTTVGFGEVHPLSPAGRIFTMVVIVLGVGSAAYLLGRLAEYVIANELGEGLERRRRRHLVEHLSGHYIVCGYGRVGRQAAHEFAAIHVPLVVVDADPAAIAAATEAGHPCVEGDATSDEVLAQAGIDRARGLLTTLDNDAENLYVVLSARDRRPDLMIVARADLEQSEGKMLRAGANRVLSPSLLGGRRMAALALRPAVVQFLDVVMHTENLELWLEEVAVLDQSPLAGSTLRQAKVREQTGVTVLAIIQPDGTLISNPPADVPLVAGSKAIALGTREQLGRFCSLVSTGRCDLPVTLS